MAAKLLSLYLLAVAGLWVVRAAPLILDQRQDNLDGTLAEVAEPSYQPSPVNATSMSAPVNATSTSALVNATSTSAPVNVTSTSSLFNYTSTSVPVIVTSVAFKRAAPLIFVQRQNGNQTAQPNNNTCGANANGTQTQQPNGTQSLQPSATSNATCTGGGTNNFMNISA